MNNFSNQTEALQDPGMFHENILPKETWETIIINYKIKETKTLLTKLSLSISF